MTRRSSPLPPAWNRIRQLILLRDRHRCRWGELPGEGVPGQCSKYANEVDHMGSPDNHEPEFLRSLCAEHHAVRTSAQANKMRWDNYRKFPRKRPPGIHPGLRQDNEQDIP